MTRLDPGTELPAACPSAETLDLLAKRRSVPAKAMRGPAPSVGELEAMIALAARVPDHRMLAPFRFVVISADTAPAFAEAIRATTEAAEKARKKAASLYERGLATVAVISSPDTGHKTPVWEQELTVGAVCQNLIIAASASGFSAQWLTGWPAYDAQVGALLSLGQDERIAGFFFIGTAEATPEERKRPALPDIVRHWSQ